MLIIIYYIKKLKKESYENILSVEAKTFEDINDDSGREILGILADDLASICPEVVLFKDGEPETVFYDRLSVVLLEKMKEMQAEIDELKGIVNP